MKTHIHNKKSRNCDSIAIANRNRKDRKASIEVLQRESMTWKNFPDINEPETGKEVIKPLYPNDYINADLDGSDVQVRFGQSFLNTDKSKEYKNNPDSISLNGVQIRPRMVAGEKVEGEYHVSDGHHRAIWCGYHAKTFDVSEKVGFSPGASVKNMKYEEL